MRLLIQRVNRAEVTINGNEKRSIGKGLMVLTGYTRGDTEADVQRLTKKLVNLRIFEDAEGRMNLSVMDVEGDIMLVSQFTLYASTKKGNRPGFSDSAPPSEAIPLYEKTISEIQKITGKTPATGEFGALMDIDMVNHGPVTILLDSAGSD